MAPTVDRMVAYSRDADVLRFHIPQELQFLEPQRRADTWVYYGHGVLGGAGGHGAGRDALPRQHLGLLEVWID